jgi:hypothetical protein
MEGLTDEMRALLETGAATHYGRCCYPRDRRDPKIDAAVWALREAGLVFMGDNGETPIITDMGREVIGAPTASAILNREIAEASSWT